jgi:hypothetical protein
MNNNFVEKPNDMTERKKDFVGNMINIQPSELTLGYFDQKNINKINSLLLMEVKKITLSKFGKKILIKPQKNHIVLTIMRYVYFQNGNRHNILSLKSIEEKINKLNKIVLKLMLPTVIQELISYVKYVDKYNSVPVVDERPKQGFVKRGIINEYIKF